MNEKKLSIIRLSDLEKQLLLTFRPENVSIIIIIFLLFHPSQISRRSSNLPV